MTSRLLMSVLLAGGVIASAAMLSGCGKQGELERPAPLFGASAKAEYAKEQAAKDAAARLPDGNAKPNASGKDNAGDDTDVVAPPKDTPQTTPLPPRTAPISGALPDPFASGPQGALPNPYADPNRSQ